MIFLISSNIIIFLMHNISFFKRKKRKNRTINILWLVDNGTNKNTNIKYSKQKLLLIIKKYMEISIKIKK